jgi:diadenosine tetraphosphate (Ap4A) HIT family hydrolase
MHNSEESLCQTCDWVNRRDRGEAPLWDSILRTNFWDVVHGQGTSLPGWIVLVLRRHVKAMAELTKEETVEMGLLIREVSRALPSIVGCEKTYVVQFAEHPWHPHVHLHVIPRAPEMPSNERGPAVFSAHLGVSPDREVPEPEKHRIALALRKALDDAGHTSLN